MGKARKACKFWIGKLQENRNVGITKVKLLGFIKYHTMKMYGGAEV
jgi:hypothetical protein